MTLLPQRSSLISETARVLRKGVATGEWRSYLPGERDLCVRLQVSRSTLREALRLLEKQRLLVAGPGRLRKIRHVRVPQSTAAPEIGLLLLPSLLQAPRTSYYHHELRERLQNAGFYLRVFPDSRLGHQAPGKFLESLVQETRVSTWLLSSMSSAVQRWFEARALPALVLGSRHPGVNLPAFDVDLHATCRHAANLLRARGHRDLGLLRQPQKTAGMKASEAGFLEGARPSAAETIRTTLLGHDGTAEGIGLSIDRALASRHPPTGLVVCNADHALCAASHLIFRKFSLPGDFSLISRDDDRILTFFRPEITRYSYGRNLFAQRLSRLAIQLATDGHLLARNYSLIPKIIPGQTVGHPPA